MHLWLMHHPRTCALEWHPTAQESASGKLKQSLKGTSPENFMTIGGCFECYTYRVMALGCLKKEEDEQF